MPAQGGRRGGAIGAMQAVAEPDRSVASIVSSVVAGLVAGVLAVTFMYSYASVIMTGADPSLTPRLTGHFLIGGAIIATIVALWSQFRGVVALPQDTPTAVLAVVAVSVVAGSSDVRDPEELFATVLALIVVSTVVIGVLFWLVGHYRLAVLGQYVPYPVVAGFLAATGWLLFKGSFGVMSGVPFEFGDLDELWAVRELWIPGAAMALFLVVATRVSDSPLILPGVIVMCTVAYHVVRVGSDTSRTDATADGWLIEALPNRPLIESVDPGGVQWSPIGEEFFGIATIAIVAIIGVLLNLTALSSALDTDVDVDREMRILGYSNVAAGCVGSIVGFHYVSLSTLGRSMRGDSRVVGIVVGAMCLAAGTVAAGSLSLIPQFVLGGMVLFIGLGFLWDWLIMSARRLSAVDFGIVVLIVVVVELVGFLEGVAIGLLATIIHFVVTYSRTGAIRHVFSGREMHSAVERSTAQRVALSKLEQGILLVKLQGYIFFASTVGLVESITDRLSEEDAPVVDLILDFEHVTGIDESGFNGFAKLLRIARERDVTVVYAALPERLDTQFRAREGDSEAVEPIRRYRSAEAALEWCENDLLNRGGVDPASDEFSLDYTLREMFGDPDDLAHFRSALEPVDVAAGSVLPSLSGSGNLDFVESGRLAVLSTHDETTRIRRGGPGSILGIASFFKHGGPSSLVTIRAETDCRIYRLSSDAYFELVRDHPSAAASLQRHALVTISDRFADLVTSFELVMRGKA